MAERILVIDDEPDLLELVRVNLTEAGFEVETSTSGRDALASVRRAPPDLIVLDLMLPDVPGTDLCRTLRNDRRTADLPILMLTAKAAEIDRVVGFELGADDYVTKPFSPRELSLRVRALLRRAHAPERGNAFYRHGPVCLDLERHRCTVADSDVPLTAKEFDLLAELMKRPGRVLSRERLIDAVWGPGTALTERTIDTHLKRLREKLGSAGDMIETVRGVGYRFAE